MMSHGPKVLLFVYFLLNTYKRLAYAGGFVNGSRSLFSRLAPCRNGICIASGIRYSPLQRLTVGSFLHDGEIMFLEL